MKSLYPFAVALSLSLATSLPLISAEFDAQDGKVLVQSLSGQATAIDLAGKRTDLASGSYVTSGATIETGANSAVDLLFEYNGTALRLAPNSRLQLSKLVRQQSGKDLFTETDLKLLSGSVIGSQRKLNGPSSFDIQFPGGVARIKGTEYIVRSDGAVTVLSGVVTVNYNLPGNGGDVRVTIAAGQSFNPATGQVVATTPDYLQNSIADVNTVRNNAQVFKAGGATIVVKPDLTMSPSKGNNGVGNGIDPQPPGNPPINDGPGSGPGNPGNQGGGNGNGGSKGNNGKAVGK
jgi:hypothetical protein